MNFFSKLFINNEFVDAVSKKKFDVLNPATGDVVTQVRYLRFGVFTFQFAALLSAPLVGY